MNKINWKMKLSSRKFWALIGGFATGIIVLINGDTSSEAIMGAMTSLGSVVAFILGESWVDVNRTNQDDNEE